MEELRLVGFEDGAILLENLQGTSYRLVADEQLRSALRAASQGSHAAVSITPREIQDRIRQGATVDELVAISGADLEYINKFAQPVFDELAHMVESALAIRITIAGDRFNDDVQVQFGELVEQRLVAAGATRITWTSKRGEGIAWIIEAHYLLNGHQGVAIWHYDPRKFQLTPENETAVTVSNHNNTIDGPIPKLRPIDGANLRLQEAAPVTSAPQPSSAPAAFRREPEVAPEPQTATTNLLDELRKRREEAAKAEAPVDTEAVYLETEQAILNEVVLEVVETIEEPEEVVDTQVVDIQFVDDVPEVQITAENEESSEQSESSSSSKRTRPAMPSWDEIVFGTKSDE